MAEYVGAYLTGALPNVFASTRIHPGRVGELDTDMGCRLRGFEAVGDAAAVHGLKGHRSNRSLPAEVREVALSVAADPLYADFGPTLLAEHLERRFAVGVAGGRVGGRLASAPVVASDSPVGPEPTEARLPISTCCHSAAKAV